MTNILNNYIWVIIGAIVSAYVTLNFYLLRILFIRTDFKDKEIDRRIEEKINAKAVVLESKIDSIDKNVRCILDSIFKDIHIVNNNKK